jgi:hypothetical protein
VWAQLDTEHAGSTAELHLAQSEPSVLERINTDSVCVVTLAGLVTTPCSLTKILKHLKSCSPTSLHVRLLNSEQVKTWQLSNLSPSVKLAAAGLVTMPRLKTKIPRPSKSCLISSSNGIVFIPKQAEHGNTQA